MDERPRALIEARFKELKLDYSEVSLRMGRNHAYMHQYLKQGVPKHLKEDDREKLAEILGLQPDDLRANSLRAKAAVLGAALDNLREMSQARGGPLGLKPEPSDDTKHLALTEDSKGLEYNGHEYAAIPSYDVLASAGPGSFNPQYNRPERWSLLDLEELRTITRAKPQDLALLRVSGDSMDPTLQHNDRILIDQSIDRVGRDGLYVIATGEEVMVKRVTRDWGTKSLTVSSDNPLHPTSHGVQEEDIVVLGRVVWISRNVGG